MNSETEHLIKRLREVTAWLDDRPYTANASTIVEYVRKAAGIASNAIVKAQSLERRLRDEQKSREQAHDSYVTTPRDMP